MTEISRVVEPKLAWRFLVRLHLGCYQDTPAQELLAHLDPDPDSIKLSQMILRESGFGPFMELNGAMNEDLAIGIRALAVHANVDPVTGEMPQTPLQALNEDLVQRPASEFSDPLERQLQIGFGEQGGGE